MYLSLREYCRPRTEAECLRLLSDPAERSAILAGGTDLNVRGHEEITRVIDIQALPLDGVRVGDDRIEIGARVTLRRLARHEAIAGEGFTALREAALARVNRALLNRSTVGGRVMVDRPDQDLPPALAALGAEVELVRLGTGGRVVRERIPYPLGRTARSRLGGALLVAVILPRDPLRSSLSRMGRTAVDDPLAVGAAVLTRRGEWRLAANLQGPSAGDLRRLPATEALCVGWSRGRPVDWRERLRESLLGELAGFGDFRASGAYRKDLTATLLGRAVARVWGEEEWGGESRSGRMGGLPAADDGSPGAERSQGGPDRRGDGR